MLASLKRYAPRRLRERAGEWAGECRRHLRLAPEIGMSGALAVAIRNRVGTQGAAYPLDVRSAKHRLYYRLGSSDLDVFEQIFIDREYAPLCDLPEVGLILDCGANIGYSSAFFLSRFPSCCVIAIEPEQGNFSMLERNLKAYGSRAKVIRAGIWNENVPLRVSREQYRDGREWTAQVQPCEEQHEPEFQGMTVSSLLETSGYNRISLLKMDIEGAEAVVFQKNIDWLESVDAIAIELHDDSSFGEATEIFHKAIRGRGFTISRSGELTICR